jgi:hypothetical protein
MYHAWYSETSAQKFGSVNYLRPNGEIVKTTSVAKDINHQHNYDDKIYLGEVVKYHSINPPTNNNKKWEIEGNDIF